MRRKMKTEVVHIIKRNKTTSMDKLFDYLKRECKRRNITQIVMDADTQRITMVEIIEV